MVFDPVVTIAVISLIFSVVSTLANHKIGGRSRVKQLQKEVNDFQKRFEKATKEKDEKELEKLKILEPEVMSKMQEMLILPIKSMVVILPLFFIFIAGIQYLHPSFLITLPFAIHVNEIFALKMFEPSVYGSRGFFIVCSIVFNLAFEALYSNFFEKQNKNKP